MRIASFLPSATEIVYALGLGDAVVAVSHDCDYPPDVRTKPVLSEAIVTTALPSPTIDQRIRGQVHRGNSVYHLDQDELARLHPNLILTQELCTVCAPSYTLVKEVAKVLNADVRIVSLEPHGLTDVLGTILLVGQMTETEDRAMDLVARLRARIDAVRGRAAGLPRPCVVCLEWLDPLFVGGHWVPEMVALAGGQDVLGRAGEPSFTVEWDAVVAAEPEVLVLMPCGFDVARTRQELHLLMDRPGWTTLPAVRAGRVYLTDASAYFSRPGPRIVDGLELLAAILHPEAFAFTCPPAAAELL